MTTPESMPVALVTGAGRGIGRAVAVRLSEAGYRVALTSRSTDELEAVAGACPGPTLVRPCDITDAAAVEDLFAGVEREWGPVEVLVANAGAGVSASVAKTTDEQWQRMLDLNLTAPFRCLRRAIPSMVERRTGRIVVIASVAAKIGEPYISAYTASKHGVLGLVRSAAAELARTGVTVNAVCPGYVDTPWHSNAVGSERAQQVAAHYASMVPLKDFARPDDVAEVICWLIEGARQVTGEAIYVDGGLHITPPR